MYFSRCAELSFAEIIQVHKLRRASVTTPRCSGTGSHNKTRAFYFVVSKKCEKGKYFKIKEVTLSFAVIRVTIGMTLFQKEHEQRRRRKSKAQLYEMIQAIRKLVCVLFIKF